MQVKDNIKVMACKEERTVKAVRGKGRKRKVRQIKATAGGGVGGSRESGSQAPSSSGGT